jgi:hypothetical protein
MEHGYKNLFWINNFKEKVNVIRNDIFQSYSLLYFEYDDKYYLFGYTPSYHNGNFPFLTEEFDNKKFNLKLEYEFDGVNSEVTIKIPSSIIPPSFNYDMDIDLFIDTYLKN